MASEIKIFEGALNVNVLRPGPFVHGKRLNLLWRFPKVNEAIMTSIKHEYNTIGFLQDGGTFRRRSPEEQTKFTQYCAQHGLRVVPPYIDGDDHIKNIYLEDAVTLDNYLLTADITQATHIAKELFTDMIKAHSLGTVYGDRWSENILIRPNGELIHIDFDLEIKGKHVREFEAAQAAYYVLAGAKEKIIPVLSSLLTAPHARWRVDKLEKYLIGHAQHFMHNIKYGGLISEVDTLVALMQHSRYAQAQSGN